MSTERIIVLDTETTGMPAANGHRVIEFGACVIEGRRITDEVYHVYFNPEREIEAGALAVHGITEAFLADKPLFCEHAEKLFQFLSNQTLVIHNAAFDVGFLDAEWARVKQANGQAYPALSTVCTVVDTLKVARQKHAGQSNSLDALCKRYRIDNSAREHHGALLDARILAQVYLAMTGGQVSLSLGEQEVSSAKKVEHHWRRTSSEPLLVVNASSAEIHAHNEIMRAIDSEE